MKSSEKVIISSTHQNELLEKKTCDSVLEHMDDWGRSQCSQCELSLTDLQINNLNRGCG